MRKVLRQDDPMSLILSNIIVDMLATFIARAKEDVKNCGLIPHLVEGGVCILPHVDDTSFSWSMIWRKL